MYFCTNNASKRGIFTCGQHEQGGRRRRVSGQRLPDPNRRQPLLFSVVAHQKVDLVPRLEPPALGPRPISTACTQLLRCQYLYFCTSNCTTKASKVRTWLDEVRPLDVVYRPRNLQILNARSCVSFCTFVLVKRVNLSTGALAPLSLRIALAPLGHLQVLSLLALLVQKYKY